MIFWYLFLTFCKIGTFNFGGGYSMIALIQREMIANGWMSTQEFTDIVALSQMTPGPIGINVATYAGYTAVVNAGYSNAMGIAGAFLASFSIILIPTILMLLVSAFLLKHKENKHVKNVLSMLRITIIGVIASACLVLSTSDNFGSPSQAPFQFCISMVIFLSVFWASYKHKTNPILLLLICGVIGFFAYYFSLI